MVCNWFISRSRTTLETFIFVFPIVNIFEIFQPLWVDCWLCSKAAPELQLAVKWFFHFGQRQVATVRAIIICGHLEQSDDRDQWNVMTALSLSRYCRYCRYLDRLDSVSVHSWLTLQLPCHLDDSLKFIWEWIEPFIDTIQWYDIAAIWNTRRQ